MQDGEASVSEQLTSSGTVVVARIYKPYGGVLYQSSSSSETDHNYTGQILDGSGLLYYNARYYDAIVGQFTSGDFVQGPNRYGYVGGNPETLTDPSGYVPDNLHDGGGDGGEDDGLWSDSYTYDPSNPSYTINGGETPAEISAYEQEVALENTAYDALTQPGVSDTFSVFSETDVAASTIDTTPTSSESIAQEMQQYDASLQSSNIPEPQTVAPEPLTETESPTSSKTTPLRSAQKTASWTFSKEGKFSGQTIGDVSEQLQEGTLNPENVPVQYLERDGARIIINTRSSLALTQAGIDESTWALEDVTGEAAWEDKVTDRLAHNRLSSPGIPLNEVRIIYPR